MQPALLRYINGITRVVETREHKGKRAHVVSAGCAYRTSVADLWDAITDAERINEWFLPISGDLRLGGRYQLERNAGGQILQCVPPRQLRFTWQLGPDVASVAVRLSRTKSGSARLRLQHVAHIPEDIWNSFGPGCIGVSWDLAFMALGMHLIHPGPSDRGEANDWAASEEGSEFVRNSSDAWARASMDFGTSEEIARAAADRTVEFYSFYFSGGVTV